MNDRIRKVTASTGIITTVAGSGTQGFAGDGLPATDPGVEIGIRFGGGLSVDAAGNIYFADSDNNRVREIIAGTGIITTVAGGGSPCAAATDALGDGCPPTDATLNFPVAVRVNDTGNVTVLDTNDNCVRRIYEPSGHYVDLKGQDTDTEHDTIQTATPGNMNPPTNVQLFNSPVGYPSSNAWHPRDIGLAQVPATDLVGPAFTPFDAQLAPAANDPALVALTNEEGVTLTVGLGSVDGGVPGPSAGAVNGSTITYPAPNSSSPTDLSARTTVMGVDLGLSIRQSGAQGAATFTLTPGDGTAFAQDATGLITATTTVTSTDQLGNEYPDSQPAFFIENPVAVDSNPDPAGYAMSGAVTMSLSDGPSGQQTLTVQVDQAWLSDPQRVFPIHVDIPIVTADAAQRAGISGSLAGCQPSAAVPQTDAVAGTEGQCAYRGFEYFDVSTIPQDATIVSATLHLFTPDQTGTTSVVAYPNSAPAQATLLLSWQPPTWDTAPSPASGAPGIAQSASDGHWQTWDVTNVVAGWQADASTNYGLSLESAAAPVRFASANGAGSGTPDTAPYLAIVYNAAGTAATGAVASGVLAHAASAAAPGMNDGASSNYGVAGAFIPDIHADGTPFGRPAGCPTPTVPGCGGAIPVSTVKTKLHGSYIRVGVGLDCVTAGTVPGLAWWGGTQAVSSAIGNGNQGSILDILASAHAAGLIPVVDILPTSDASCTGAVGASSRTADSWSTQAADLASVLIQQLYTSGPYQPGDTIDFEIGNEENGFAYQTDYDNYTFPSIFARAATALYGALHTTQLRYWIMPGAVTHPTAHPGCTASIDKASPGRTNILLIQEAIYDAEHPDPSIRAHLAVAVHPYTYADQGFRNFRFYAGIIYKNNTNNGSTCFDLGTMLRFWTVTGGFSSYPGVPGIASLAGLPLFFTEVDWDGFDSRKYPTLAQDDGNPNYRGSYLVDLFTFVNKYVGRYHEAPIRVMWFNGANTGSLLLGIYSFGTCRDGNGQPIAHCYESPTGEMPVQIPHSQKKTIITRINRRTQTSVIYISSYCPKLNSVAGTKNMSSDFQILTNHLCY